MPTPVLVIFHWLIYICFLPLPLLPYALRHCPLRTVSPVLLWLIQWEVYQQEVYNTEGQQDPGISSLLPACSVPDFWQLLYPSPTTGSVGQCLPWVPLTLLLTLDFLVLGVIMISQCCKSLNALIFCCPINSVHTFVNTLLSPT